MSILIALILSPFQPPELPDFRPPRTLYEVIERAVVYPDDTLVGGRMLAELKRYCRAGEPVACLLGQGDWASPEFGALCADGDPDACVVEAWLAGSREPHERRLAQACARGGQAACLVAVRMRTRATGPSEFARVFAEQACRDGLAAGCLLRTELEPDPRVRQAQLNALCTDGHARACLNLWAAASVGPERDPTLAAHAALRGCGLGVARLCERAIDAWQVGDGVSPDARLVKRLRGQACQAGLTSACGRGTTASVGSARSKGRRKSK